MWSVACTQLVTQERVSRRDSLLKKVSRIFPYTQDPVGRKSRGKKKCVGASLEHSQTFVQHLCYTGAQNSVSRECKLVTVKTSTAYSKDAYLAALLPRVLLPRVAHRDMLSRKPSRKT